MLIWVWTVVCDVLMFIVTLFILIIMGRTTLYVTLHMER